MDYCRFLFLSVDFSIDTSANFCFPHQFSVSPTFSFTFISAIFYLSNHCYILGKKILSTLCLTFKKQQEQQ